jgi:acyl-CoA thioester hydrolase
VARDDFWFKHRLRVRFVEVDTLGVLHNSHYLAYFGIALHEYYRALGYDRMAAGQAANTGLYVVSANVEYKSPLLFDDEADVCARIAKLGRTSLTFGYEVYKVAGDALAATGSQVWVNADRTTRQSTPWDPTFVALVERAEHRSMTLQARDA